MKNAFLPIVLGLFLMACSPEPTPKQENILADGNESFSTKGNRGEGILEALYLELKEQRPELHVLDQQIEEVDRAKAEALKNYYDYNTKNENYYSEAHQSLPLIKDSLLRNNVELLLNKSQYAYDQENAAMALTAAQLENRSVSLHDRKEALKIILTMNLLQKYQKKQTLDANEYEKIIARYNKSISKADSLLQAK